MVGSTNVWADCLTDKGQECIQAEKGNSNNSRGGVDVYEFCAAQASIICGGSSGNAAGSTPKLNNLDECEKKASSSGNWNKEVYHDCMGTPEGFRW